MEKPLRETLSGPLSLDSDGENGVIMVSSLAEFKKRDLRNLREMSLRKEDLGNLRDKAVEKLLFLFHERAKIVIILHNLYRH